ncbi:hypothetical protein T492DRAFT_333301 [Pavlovales sp. CCMP2436]|nr:hypothetical protein T492DRAFT_333301 [Pavlovales sp. CCMP2436]
MSFRRATRHPSSSVRRSSTACGSREPPSQRTVRLAPPTFKSSARSCGEPLREPEGDQGEENLGGSPGEA